MNNKRCPKCNETKPIDQFYKCRSNYSGYQTYCKACQNTQVRSGKRLHVDHDHETGKIRALLCHNCNVALGHAFDSIDRLEGMIKYLKEHYDG